MSEARSTEERLIDRIRRTYPKVKFIEGPYGHIYWTPHFCPSDADDLLINAHNEAINEAYGFKDVAQSFGDIITVLCAEYLDDEFKNFDKCDQDSMDAAIMDYGINSVESLIEAVKSMPGLFFVMRDK